MVVMWIIIHQLLVSEFVPLLRHTLDFIYCALIGYCQGSGLIMRAHRADTYRCISSLSSNRELPPGGDSNTAIAGARSDRRVIVITCPTIADHIDFMFICNLKKNKYLKCVIWRTRAKRTRFLTPFVYSSSGKRDPIKKLL